MSSLIDLKKLREQTLYDNYGLTNQGFDPSAGMTDNPVQDPFSSIPNIRPPAGDAPTPNFMEGMDTPRQDEYNRLLASKPEREDPGLIRRIVAAGMGFGKNNAVEIQDNVINAPNRAKLADWASQVEPAYKSAQLENTANTNERQLRGNILTNETNMRRYENANKIAEDKNEITRTKNERDAKIREQKIQADSAWRMGYTFSVVGNKLMAHAPDGSSYEAGEAADYSPLEIAKMKHKYTMEEIGKRTEGAIETKQAVPGANPTNNPGNANKDRNNKFQKVYDENPDLQKWFIQPTTTNGSWQMKEAPKMGRWLTGNATEDAEIESYNRARTALGLPTIKTRNSDTKPAVQPANTGRIKVVDPKTGRTGSIDNTKEAIEAASKAGLRVEVGK